MFTPEVKAAVELLIETTAKREIDFALRGYLSAVAHLREFRTVHIDLGRRTGKSTFIREQLQFHKDDIAIVGRQELVRQLYEDVAPNRVLVGSDRTGLYAGMRRLGKVRRVYVDEPSMVNLDTVYETLSTLAPPPACVVLLGAR